MPRIKLVYGFIGAFCFGLWMFAWVTLSDRLYTNEFDDVEYENENFHLLKRKLGNSDLLVSILSVGSWRTFERLNEQEAIKLMKAIDSTGVINFLDDAKYSPEAPISWSGISNEEIEERKQMGFSEIFFGRIFRGANLQRNKYILANKLWLSDYQGHSPKNNNQSLANEKRTVPQNPFIENYLFKELNESLERMKMDYYDVVYMSELSQTNSLISLDTFVSHVSEVLKSKKIRYWGFLNWNMDDIDRVVKICEDKKVPKPIALQISYNLLHFDRVAYMEKRLKNVNVSVVAAQSLGNGMLTGNARFRQVESLLGRDEPHHISKLRKMAEQRSVPTSAMALAWCMNSRPSLVASCLFGIKSENHLYQNLQAAKLLLSPSELESLSKEFPTLPNHRAI